MRISVRLFASHRELMGTNHIDLDVPDETTVAEVYDRLTVLEPALDRLRSFTSFAVNREIVSADCVIRAGDEIALLQPVSGG